MGWQEVRPGPGRGRKLETLLVKPGGSRQGVCPVGGGVRGHNILLQESTGREDRVSSPSLGFQRGSMAPRRKQRPLKCD